MQRAAIQRIIGLLLMLFSMTMIPPAIVGLIYRDGSVYPFFIAFLLNLTFTIIEIIGGIMTNSVAIIADAIHDLGDALSLGSSWEIGRAHV